MLQLKTRPRKADDLAALIATYSASIRELAAPYYSPEQIAAWAPVTPDLARWEERLAALSTVVAESDGFLAGFVSYRHGGYLDLLCTHPTYARCGVGSLLYRTAESALRRLGIARITTHASLAARRFFEQQSFSVDAEECVECRGVLLRRFAMHKLLGDGEQA
jgi:putative acetyltransferase